MTWCYWGSASFSQQFCWLSRWEAAPSRAGPGLALCGRIANRTAEWWVPSSAAVSHQTQLSFPSQSYVLLLFWGLSNGGMCVWLLSLNLMNSDNGGQWQEENSPPYLWLCLKKAWSIYSSWASTVIYQRGKGSGHLAIVLCTAPS